jgi:Domain of unknown function (DUF5069)
MTALDLTQTPPRWPRAELRGICMLPRMIDIARAKLPGGTIGAYQIGRGLSGLVLGQLGIDAAAFVEIVSNAANDEIVADRVCAGRSTKENRLLSLTLRRLTVANVPEDLRESFVRFYGKDLPPDKRIFDVLEEDDAGAFGEIRVRDS